MRISIVIATMNAGKYLAKCLDSCIAQTYPDKEIVVIDGGSTDDTLGIIRDRESHIAFWMSERDNGIYDAWNKALAHVTGDWVLFRGADDTFWNDASLADAAQGMEDALPNEMLCYGLVVHSDEDGQLVQISGEPWERAKAVIMTTFSFPHPGTFHRVELFRRFGPFNPSYRIAGDYDFILRVLAAGVDVKFLPGVVISNMSGSGISQKRAFLTKKESIAAIRKITSCRYPISQYKDIVKLAVNATHRAVLNFLLGIERANALRLRRRGRRSERLKVLLAGLPMKPGGMS